MTLPLSRILLDRDLLHRLPGYATTVTRRIRKRALLTLGARLVPDRLLLESVAILDWDRTPEVADPALLNRRIPGMTDLRIIEPYRYHDVPDGRERAFLQLCGVPDTHAYSPMSFTCRLAGATIQMDDGVVCTSDFRLLEDSTLGRRRLTLSSAYGEPRPSGVCLRGSYSTVWCQYAANHYHWLFDALPRLYSLDRSPRGGITLLMPSDLSPGYKRMLDWCLPASMSVRYVPRGSWWRVEDLTFASITEDLHRSQMPEPHTRYVRGRVLDALGLEDRGELGSKRIYVSRGDTRARRLLNEAELIDVLRGYGFTPYSLGGMDIEEQVRLFHDAECVVAPHGAGLANMLFAGAIPLVELISPHLSPCYLMLARILGQEHHYVEVEADPQVRTNRDARMHDFRVSVEAVEAEVRSALSSPLLA